MAQQMQAQIDVERIYGRLAQGLDQSTHSTNGHFAPNVLLKGSYRCCLTQLSERLIGKIIGPAAVDLLRKARIGKPSVENSPVVGDRRQSTTDSTRTFRRYLSHVVPFGEASVANYRCDAMKVRANIRSSNGRVTSSFSNECPGWVIRDWGETTADQAISGRPRLLPVLAMQPKNRMCQNRHF
jgi:hypothetical protein